MDAMRKIDRMMIRAAVVVIIGLCVIAWLSLTADAGAL